jgi:hypothetical protein
MGDIIRELDRVSGKGDIIRQLGDIIREQKCLKSDKKFQSKRTFSNF